MPPALVPDSASRSTFALPSMYVLEGDSMRIGRSEENDIVFPQQVKTISRLHAVLDHQGSRWLIRNMSKSNPVEINDEEVSKKILNDGDRVQLGDVTLLYRESSENLEDSTIIEREVNAPFSDTTVGPDAGRSHFLLEGLIRLLEDAASLQRSSDMYTLLKEFLTRELSCDLVMVMPSHGGDLRADPDHVGSEVAYSTTYIHHAWENQKAVLWEDSQPTSSLSVGGFGIRSVICAPVLSSDGPRAIIYVHRMRAPFYADDLDFVRACARVVALADENLRLRQSMREEIQDLRSQVQDGEAEVVTAGKGFRAVVDDAARIAQGAFPVLVRGETGAGKDVVAKVIHRTSPRAPEPFVAINCASIPETLLESELFGYVPNSGIANAAKEGKPGKFQVADGGTLFLDEIGDMSMSLQAKILRVLEDKEVYRLGALEPEHVDIRIVCATNQPLEKLIEEGRFRPDLMQRIAGYTIAVPPLGERRDEIVPLALHFLRETHRSSGTVPPDPMLTDEAAKMLRDAPWPGNVRQLKYCVQAAHAIAHGGAVDTDSLGVTLNVPTSEIREPLKTLEEVVREHILRTLRATGNKRGTAAEILGIHRNTLTEKLRKMAEDGHDVP